MEDSKAHFPQPIPECYKVGVDLMEERAKFHFNAYAIPYAIISKMATQRFTKLEDIAERWPETSLRSCASKDLGLEIMETYSDEDRVFYATRLLHVCRRARQELADNSLASSYGSAPRRPRPGDQGQTLSNQTLLNADKSERNAIIQCWRTRAPNHPAPQLSEIGSPEMIKSMKATMQGGDIPLLGITKIVPAQGTTNDQPIVRKVWKQSQWGSLVETEDITSRWPQDRKGWEKTLTIWRNTLIGLIYTMPSIPTFVDTTMEDLDSFYGYILGREIAGRSPEPPLSSLIHAERNVWKEINLHITEGSTLKDAMTTMKTNGLFWMTALGYSPHTNHYYEGKKPSRHKQWSGNSAAASYLQTGESPNKKQSAGNKYVSQWQKGKHKGDNNNYPGDSGSYKGDGGKLGKTKGGGKGGKLGKVGKGSKPGKVGKGGKSVKGYGGVKGWQSQWANRDKTGKEFCRNYHTTGCQAGELCPRSHKCPVQKDGWICLQPHRAGDCNSNM